MRRISPAKINLSLNVGAADQSGYHRVDSVFHLLDFGDEITIELADQLKLTCSIDLGIDAHRNLAYRAALRMGEVFDREPKVHIHIEKHIPHGAGLGGGSSNAATVMRILCVLWDIDTQDPRVLAIAAELGADVAVFLAPTPASVMGHYGEQLSESLPGAPGTPLVLAMPSAAHVPTGDVYRAFDANPQPTKPAEELIRLLRGPAKPSTYDLASLLYNNLSDASIAVCADVAELRDFLTQCSGVAGALVSGSGGASFALCESVEAAMLVSRMCVDKGYWSVATTLA